MCFICFYRQIFLAATAAFWMLAASAQVPGRPWQAPADPSYEMREISCVSDGNRLYGEAFIPRSPGKHPAVIMSHGYGASHTGFYAMVDTLAKSGYVCYCYDFAGGSRSGRSEGRTEDMSIFTERQNLMDVIDMVRSWNCVDAESIFLLGESQGGMVTACLASELKDKIRGAILWYPAFVIPDDSAKRIADGVSNFGGVDLSPDYDKVAVEIDIHEVMHGFDGPVLLIHGDKDGLVPIRYSEEADRTYADSELIVIPGAGHGFNARDAVFAIDRSVDFMIRHLKPRSRLFTLHINCFDSYEVKETGTGRTIRQVLFDGEAEGNVFNGRILPGGVDTQVVESSGEGTLSARYILEGKDADGRLCKMYIDNRGRLSEKVTYPTIRSDSAGLDALGNSPLVGYKESDEDGFRIVIYQC